MDFLDVSPTTMMQGRSKLEILMSRARQHPDLFRQLHPANSANAFADAAGLYSPATSLRSALGMAGPTSMVALQGPFFNNPAGVPVRRINNTQDIPERFTKNGRRRAVPFPLKLMKVLSDPQNSHIISWMPGGRSFAVVNPKKFVEEILPKDFKSAKYASFTRKLHRWGFLRVDDISGEFYHRLFQRNRFDLAEKMSCHKTDEEPKSLQARNGSAPKCASKSDGAVAAADEKKSSAGPPADQLSHSNNSTGSSSSSGATHQVQASPNPSRGCAVPTTPSLRALQQQGMSSPPSPMAAVSRQLQFGGVTPQEQANLRAELQTAELLTLLREQKFQQTKLELSAARYRRLAALSMSALSPSASMAGTQSFTLPPSSQLFGRMGRHHPHEAGATTDDAPPSSPMTPNTEGAKTA